MNQDQIDKLPTPIERLRAHWWKSAGDIQAIRHYAKQLKKLDIVDLIDELEKELRNIEVNI